VLEKDPAIEAAALGPFASRLELNVLPRHVVCLRQRSEHLQHVGEFRGQMLIRCRL
jgi:hypothetical protein